VGERTVTLAGDSPRGTLNAVYWLLEQLGFAWVEPGEVGVSFLPGAALAPGSYREEPSFAARTLILGQDALHDDWPAWMEWASRNRFNDLFFHDTPPSRMDRGGAPRPARDAELAADGGGWMFERWRSDGQAIVAEAARRGLTLQFGGHHLPGLVPRELFAEHPESFPLRGGGRDPRYNLCPTSAGALAQAEKAAAAFVARFPGASVYHLWPDDIRGGGWCECAGCEGMSPSDQALLATNAVAAAVGRAAPGARVAHLAYHDTVRPPVRVEPRENLALLWAPRERCYAHSIDDASCTKNAKEYWAPFLGLLAHFGNDRTRVQVFEYYSDAILFKGMAPAHLAVLPKDARAYASAGAGNLQDLMVGNRPWVGPPWHAWWTARCAWNADADADVALEHFCAAAFPGAAGDMAAVYRAEEAAYGQLLDLHDLEGIARHDVLDFSDRPRTTLGLKAREALKAAEMLTGARDSLRAIQGASPVGRERIGRERAQLEVVAAFAGHLAARTAAWDAGLAGDLARSRSFLDRAEEELTAIDVWDREWTKPAYAVIRENMARARRYHTAELRRRFGDGVHG
jgi:hypothetical protein